MRYYVLSDIHGFFREMQTALEGSGYYTDSGEKKIILCGDLFDRGNREGTLALQSWVAEGLKKQEIVLVRGNHEDLMEELVENLDQFTENALKNRSDPLAFHVTNQTTDTLAFLTGTTVRDFIDRPAFVRQKFRETPLFQTILPAALDFYETKCHVFVHGWIPFDTSGLNSRPREYRFLPSWREASPEEWADARWYNGMAAWSKGIVEPNKTIVCGHYHCSWGHCFLEGKGDETGPFADFSPFLSDGILAIDACTALSGKVNCVVIEE